MTDPNETLPRGPALPAFEYRGANVIPQLMYVWGSEWMRERDLVAVLSALDPEARARIFRASLDGPSWDIIDAEAERDAERTLAMTDAEIDAEIVAAGQDPERIHRWAKATGRWVSLLAAKQVELTSARSEVDRLKSRVAELEQELATANEELERYHPDR